MKKRGKRYREIAQAVDRLKSYDLNEALPLLKKTATSKFGETVDLAVHLGVDPRHAEQNIRGTVALPHGTGREVRVVVFAEGEKAREAEEAGADVVGSDDLIERIAGGWLEFDAVVATPDMMRRISSKLGRILGPRGLMPNPKAGTVTMDVGEAIANIKAGQIEYRVEKQSGVIHVPVGKSSFDAHQIQENIETVMSTLIRARPSSAKGRYLKSVAISSTMGVGIRLNPQQFS
ncbi:MAG: 50S ribosomal protein L1 [Candidatus Poribacteria bacterium]|nr:50S ribosomal protein L1 [Candidatus Poribacteria bacterium]